MPQTARTQTRRWVIRPADGRAQVLSDQLRLPPLLAQVLINRGYRDADSAKTFLEPRLTDLVKPEYTPGVKAAATRMTKAVEAGRKITIYGDYDVDGIAGVVILLSLLTRMGANVDYYIPHRIEEGYGLNEEAVRHLGSSGTNLLVTVDCGITASQTVALARQLGMEVIVTDHHTPSEQMPPADVIVHPGLEGGDPAGATVAMKLAWEIASRLAGGGRVTADMRQFMLDATCLAALGTICDLVELRGENRVLTHFGLKAVAHCGIQGLQALIQSAGLDRKGLASQDIGFILGPMLNAAGRMGHARLAVELLTCTNPSRCCQIADYLKAQNALRQSYCQRIFNEACQMIQQQGLNDPDRRTIVVCGQDWHLGLVGIVASKIVDRFGRPAIVLSGQEGDLVQGSGRSIPGFCLLEGLKACAGHLAGFGGHSMAVGLRLERANLAAFVQGLEDYARQNLTAEDLAPKLVVDAVAPLDEFSIDMVRKMEALAPFGQGNPRPVFACRGVRWLTPPRRVGSRQDHLRLAVSDNTGAARCIGFGMGDLEKRLLEVDFFDIAFEPHLNRYNGTTSVDLVLLDVQADRV